MRNSERNRSEGGGRVIEALAHPVLGHRLVLRAQAELRGRTVMAVIDEILLSEPSPDAPSPERGRMSNRLP